MAIRLAGQRWEYTLEDDRSSEAPTVFVIRELTHGERGEILGIYQPPPQQGDEEPDEDFRSRLEEWTRQTRDAHRRICLLGLEEVRGILDAEGTPVEFPVEQVVDGLADPEHVRELALAILERNRLGSDEKKD